MRPVRPTHAILRTPFGSLMAASGYDQRFGRRGTMPTELLKTRSIETGYGLPSKPSLATAEQKLVSVISPTLMLLEEVAKVMYKRVSCLPR